MALAAKSESRRGTLQIYLAGSDPEGRSQVRKTLVLLGDDPPLEVTEIDLKAALAEAEQGSGAASASQQGKPADVVMVLFVENEEDALAYLRNQADSTPHPILFALLSERSPSLMRRALRAGAEELLFLPLDQGEAIRAMLKISEARRKAEHDLGGIIFSLTSLVGGVGVTTIAANLALYLRQELEKRVAIVDLDLQASGLSVFFNMDPERTILPLTRLERKLDSIQLESALTKHSSGLHILAAPKRIEDSEWVSDITVGAVLDLMGQLFDYVVVDCGSHVDENTVAAWERSEQVLYILDQSIASARCAWRFMELFGRLQLSGLEPRFILNRYVANHPIGEKQVAHTLARPIYAKLPCEDETMERLQLTGQDLWQVAPGSALRRAIEDLARRLTAGPQQLSPPEQAPGGASFMARLLAAVGARA